MEVLIREVSLQYIKDIYKRISLTILDIIITTIIIIIDNLDHNYAFDDSYM